MNVFRCDRHLESTRKRGVLSALGIRPKEAARNDFRAFSPFFKYFKLILLEIFYFFLVFFPELRVLRTVHPERADRNVPVRSKTVHLEQLASRCGLVAKF